MCCIMYIENTYIDVFCPRLCLLYLVNIFICMIGYMLVQYSLKDMVRISSSELPGMYDQEQHTVRYDRLTIGIPYLPYGMPYLPYGIVRKCRYRVLSHFLPYFVLFPQCSRLQPTDNLLLQSSILARNVR